MNFTVFALPIATNGPQQDNSYLKGIQPAPQQQYHCIMEPDTSRAASHHENHTFSLQNVSPSEPRVYNQGLRNCDDEMKARKPRRGNITIV